LGEYLMVGIFIMRLYYGLWENFSSAHQLAASPFSTA
jgi:hypothetical protein